MLDICQATLTATWTSR